VKTGEIDPALWIPLEDMGDGWTKSGGVGQEIYGAGIPFGIVPRHYLKVPDEEFMIYVDYPTTDFTCKRGKPVSFELKGDRRLACRMLIVNTGKKELPQFIITGDEQEKIEGKLRKDGHLEVELHGGQKINIDWK
jgi:hypothetical protein